MQTIAARIDSRIAANRNFFNPRTNQTTDRKITITQTKINGVLIRKLQIQNLVVHYPMKKKKEEKEKTFVFIVDLLNTYLIIVHLEIKIKITKINLHQVALIFLILKSNLPQDQEFLIQISQFMNLL